MVAGRGCHIKDGKDGFESVNTFADVKDGELEIVFMVDQRGPDNAKQHVLATQAF